MYLMGNILWVKDLFINDTFMTREEFNKHSGCRSRNVMRYNFLKTVVLIKVNIYYGIKIYDQEF